MDDGVGNNDGDDREEVDDEEEDELLLDEEEEDEDDEEDEEEDDDEDEDDEEKEEEEDDDEAQAAADGVNVTNTVTLPVSSLAPQSRSARYSCCPAGSDAGSTMVRLSGEVDVLNTGRYSVNEVLLLPGADAMR